MTPNSLPATDVKEQKYLKEKGLIVFIAFLSAFIPLSTDLYLPALPSMVEHFNVSVNLLNLTLTLFFVFYSAGILLWGPLSDKYGRKPVLLAGLVLYTIASLFCANAANIYQLIIFRVFQAVGCSAAGAVSMAIVKDAYNNRTREVVLALVQSMVMIGPAVAPVIGALLLRFTSWRGVFLTLAAAGLLALAGAAAYQETIARRNQGNLLQTMGRLGAVLQNPGFTTLLILFSLINIPFMAFIASSSYIYIDGFGLSEQVYSYYFAFNALCLMMGPMLYMRLSTAISRRSIILACFFMVAAGGLLVCGLGNLQPWLFAASILPATVASSIFRPPSTLLMLEQQQEDTGSASSLMGCFGIFMGSVGMQLISFDWGNTVVALGTMNLVTGLLSGALWLYISKRPFIKQVPDTFAAAAASEGK